MTDPAKDHRADYDVFRLLLNGQRMMDDYTEADAVDDYLRLHPEASRTAVEASLQAAIAQAPKA